MTKEELTNGKYWLIIAYYPSPGFETYNIIKSDKNPEEDNYFNSFILPKICEACFEEYCYIDYPDEKAYDDELEYQEDLDFYESLRYEIYTECKLITKELVESVYGECWYGFDVDEPYYDLTK